MSKFSKAYLIVLSIIMVALLGFLIFFRNLPSEAIVGFLGVLVGSIVTGFVQYFMSEANMQQQMRLAALDKRLQTHQEAFTRWEHLFNPRQTEEYKQLILDCEDWWDNNCLYLSAEARLAFKDACIAASFLSQPSQFQAEPEDRRMNRKLLRRAGEIIVKGVYLPSIGEDEFKRIGTQSSDGDA